MSIKCQNCGFDDNRDIARFCKQCGQPLTPPSPTPAPGQSLVPRGGSPPVLVPPGGPIAPLRAWQEPPQVEGRVLYVDGPHKQKKGDLAGKITLGCLLSFITPFLGWLPFLSGIEIDVRYIRVLDVHTGQQRSVKMVGEPSSDISVGDVAAFWGKDEGGTLDVQGAYNYNTDAEIRLKR